VCLQRRKQFAVDAEGHTPLGDAEVLTDTDESARKLSAFHAAELADELHISLPNANIGSSVSSKRERSGVNVPRALTEAARNSSTACLPSEE
jgi:hypothetical protein